MCECSVRYVAAREAGHHVELRGLVREGVQVVGTLWFGCLQPTMADFRCMGRHKRQDMRRLTWCSEFGASNSPTYCAKGVKKRYFAP